MVPDLQAMEDSVEPSECPMLNAEKKDRSKVSPGTEKVEWKEEERCYPHWAGTDRTSYLGCLSWDTELQHINVCVGMGGHSTVQLITASD
jgi:hypothetical protein